MSWYLRLEMDVSMCELGEYSLVYTSSHTSLPRKVTFHSYLVAQRTLALLHSPGHLVVLVAPVSHLDLAGHMPLLHLFFLDKYEVCTFCLYGSI